MAVIRDGLSVLAEQVDSFDDDIHQLIRYALLDEAIDALIGSNVFTVPPVVRENLSRTPSFSRELIVLHGAMGRYHRHRAPMSPGVGLMISKQFTISEKGHTPRCRSAC